MSAPAPREQQRQFWLQIQAGVRRESAAEAVGLSRRTGQKWFSHAGGVIPLYVLAPPSGTHWLSFAEREEIFVGIERGESIRSIARRLNRAPSTVQRELRRNMRHRYRSISRLYGGPGSKRRLPLDYRPSMAQERAYLRARRPKLAKLATRLELRQQVQEKLMERLSPEQIARELRREFPNDPQKWVSHETIYQSIYVQGRGALRRELATCLRTGRALRRPHRRADQRQPRAAGMVSISERPPEVENRAVPGHWEGDLILGKYGRSAIGTLVERTTRYLTLLHLPNGKSAVAVQEAMVAATKRLPKDLWKSLTWDRGVEMSRHAQISIDTGLEIYFCDPAKPWQRGSNENTNGLLRQYFPKGTDLSVHSAEHLEFVSRQMNRRPRKTLGWDSPSEALNRLLSGESPTPGVALTD